MSLKEWREKRGLTQRQLADKSGVPHSRIAATETGARPIEQASFGTVLRLADALRVSNPRKLLDDSTSQKENNAD
ncbi:helix-turn-helix transcriptional regulator [Bifidobacterium sp. SO1]|uniref:helix-turn-helix domain-containing protein n=1 Tax=Bifidobacterium sp. SO1 TaxID=2809029 RepID=UPI001BDC9FAD|nr:helix-turn-helix transcriptional regulator [Bifidobacterium sp. SO1]MBT1161225.1 helix-turn-helix transcriptional regulator [Bifidobacterium sp. SO1]